MSDSLKIILATMVEKGISKISVCISCNTHWLLRSLTVNLILTNSIFMTQQHSCFGTLNESLPSSKKFMLTMLGCWTASSLLNMNLLIGLPCSLHKLVMKRVVMVNLQLSTVAVLADSSQNQIWANLWLNVLIKKNIIINYVALLSLWYNLMFQVIDTHNLTPSYLYRDWIL